MGGFVDDCLDVLRFSFSWAIDNAVYGLLGIMAVLTFFQAVLSLGIEATNNALIVLPASILYIAVSLVVYYFSAKAILRALKTKGFGNIEYGPLPFLKLVVLSIFSSISSLIPWLDFRLLAANIIAIVLVVVFAVLAFLSRSPITVGLFLMALGLAMAVIGSITIYTSMRLLPASYLFLGGKADIVDSVRNSWKMTNGRFWKMFGTIFCNGLVLLIGFAGILLLFILANVMTFVIDAAIFRAQRPVTSLLAILFQTVFIPVFTFISMYMMVGVYSLVDSPGGVGSPRKEAQNKLAPAPSPLPEPEGEKPPLVPAQKQGSPKPAKKQAPKPLAKKPDKKKGSK